MTESIKTAAHIELESHKSCSGAVWECQERKRIVATPNSYQVHIYGNTSYKPQCLKCGRIGQARKDYDSSLGQPVSIPDAKKYEADKRTIRDKLYKRISEQMEAQHELEKEQWREFYEAHLQSEYWKAIRSKVLQRDNYICQCCLVNKATQAHHLTYDSIRARGRF